MTRSSLLADASDALLTSIERDPLEALARVVAERLDTAVEIEADGRKVIAGERRGAERLELPLAPVEGGEPFGVFRVMRAAPFEAVDVEICRELARRTSIALDNRRLYARVRDAVLMREQFLVVASHELRTPLTAMQLQLESLTAFVATDPSLAERVGAKLGRVAHAARRMAHLVEQLLDVSRLTTGQVLVRREPVDLADLARGVVERHRADAERARCELTLNATAVPGEWDRAKIEQVVTNLLGNAIKFGKGRPIEVRVATHEQRAELTVVDHGIGIPAEDLDRVFGRFERGVPVRNYGGLGLGLYLTRQLVEAHRGTIHASATPGGGATLTVQLPKA